MSVPPFIKLNIEFDVHRLQEDLKRAEQRYHAQEVIGPYTDGSWSGIALRSNNGSASDIEAFNQGGSKDTEVLDDCPYFKEVLGQLGFSSGVVRLLFLPAGKVIGSHRDKNSWVNGYVRLHLPIVTHKDVTMIIDGQKQFMAAGELWFGDFSKLHSVENNSDITRVHMVIDSYVNEGLLALLPEDAVAAIRAEEDIMLIPDEIQGFDGNLEDYTGFYRAKQSLPILGKVSAKENRLHMEVLGFPYSFEYHQVAKNRFRHMGNVLKTEKDENGFPILLFTVENSNIEDIRISLYEHLSVLDKVQWGIQKVLVKFGFFIFHSYSRIMKYAYKVLPYKRFSDKH